MNWMFDFLESLDFKCGKCGFSAESLGDSDLRRNDGKVFGILDGELKLIK